MKNIVYFFALILLVSCQAHEKVLYEELTPTEFSARISSCPVAYLPLGTLEWHSTHLPLGSDGIQSQEFFKRLASDVGGIVLPMLFLGPDLDTVINNHDYYGMDQAKTFNDQCKYEIQQLPGSAYWVSDSTFNVMMNSIMKQLSRAGFKVVVAHGHGPSTNFIQAHSQEFKDKYNLKVMNCWLNDSSDLCLQCDHAGANETSIMMRVRPDLVKMQNLPQDSTIWPMGMLGDDPRTKASSKYGKEIIDYEVKKMAAIILHELSL